MNIHFRVSRNTLKSLISISVITLILIPTVCAESTVSKGDLTFKFYPDGDIEVEVNGETHQTQGPFDINSYIRGLSLRHLITEEEPNQHRLESDITIYFGPQLALFLTGLEFNIEAHLNPLNSEVSVFTVVPGIVSVEGAFKMDLEEGTYNGVLETDLNVTVWYTFFQKEQIQLMLENPMLLKAEFESQVADVSGARLEVDEFNIDSEIGPINTQVTIRAVISGDWEEGLMEIANRKVSGYIDDSILNTEDLPQLLVTIKSADAHITFDSEDLALNIETETMLEGELDEQASLFKDDLFEEILVTGDIDADTKEIIEDFILPTQLKISKLNSTIIMTQEDETSIKFHMKGVKIIPPSTPVLLSYLEKASEKIDDINFTLNLVGASSNGEYVEIIIPDSTSDPLQDEPTSVSWDFAKLENLDQVSFQVKQREEETETSDPSSSYLLPTVGVAVVVALAAMLYFLKKK
jgi:hypothetical protein